MHSELMRFKTKDNVELQGLLYEPKQKGVKAIIHVHGWVGNFYENLFIDYIATSALKKNIAFFTFNNRGSGVIIEFLKNNKREKIGGSLEIFEETVFDIVIGDAVLPNVAWEDRDKLLSEVKRVLKPKGLFITRAFYVPREKPFNNVNGLLKKFTNKEPTYQSALEFVLELQILAYDSKDHLGTFSKPKEMLEKIRGKDGFNFESDNLNKILEMVWSFWCVKYVKKVYTYAYRDEEEKEYEKYFEILETYEAKDNSYSDITPMYILRLK